MSNGEERDGQIIPEIVLASEKVQRDNIQAVIQFAQDTRKIVRELDERVITLKNMIMTQQGTIANQQKQMAALQQQIYSGGTGG